MILLFASVVGGAAQTRDTLTSRLNIYNKEFDVFMVLDLRERNVIIPDHEIYGPLPGYLGKTTSTFYWMIVDADDEGKKTQLQLINDYGSEDLSATFEQLNDSTYRLTQGKGSVIKVPSKGKWMKLPSMLDFIRR
jgi:hypothetical protein